MPMVFLPMGKSGLSTPIMTGWCWVALFPWYRSLILDHVKECGTPSILDRREMGILNIGESGTVSAGGTDYTVNKGDVLYLGMGSGPVTFSGAWQGSTSCLRLRIAAARAD
jgi:5-keto 4-deoxyuronate isomerase